MFEINLRFYQTSRWLINMTEDFIVIDIWVPDFTSILSKLKRPSLNMV
jgi:hypothetical protein